MLDKTEAMILPLLCKIHSISVTVEVEPIEISVGQNSEHWRRHSNKDDLINSIAGFCATAIYGYCYTDSDL